MGMVKLQEPITRFWFALMTNTYIYECAEYEYEDHRQLTQLIVALANGAVATTARTNVVNMSE